MNFRNFLGLNRISKRTSIICASIGLIIPGVSIISSMLFGNFTASGPLDEMNILILNSEVTELIFLVFYIAIIVPIYEELIFRGIIWGTIERFYSREAAIVATTISFIICHGTIAHMIGVTPISICMAYVRHKTESVYSTSIIHIANNLIVILLMIFLLRVS